MFYLCFKCQFLSFTCWIYLFLFISCKFLLILFKDKVLVLCPSKMYKEEEEVQRDSKRFKACKGLIGKAKVFKIVVRKID